jgi:hypothetical protein
MKLQLVGMGILCVLSACTKVPTAANSTSFFNPKKIVLQQIATLENVGIQKIFTLNGKSNSAAVDKVDWKNEFNFLEDIDLDKAAYRNNILADSTQHGDTLILNLSCIENKLIFKSATAKYLNKKLVELKVITGTDNLIFNTKKTIIINPNIGYSINGYINLNESLGKQTNYAIESKFIKQNNNAR